MSIEAINGVYCQNEQILYHFLFNAAPETGCAFPLKDIS
jgi:hypothetical protein